MSLKHHITRPADHYERTLFRSSPKPELVSVPSPLPVFTPVSTERINLPKQSHFSLKTLQNILHHKPLVLSAAAQTGVDPVLLTALILQESRFNPKAVSPKGAMGLGQLMPATARELGVKDPFDAAENILGSARYLKKMLRLNNGNTTLALASYNAGYSRVKKYRGVPPFSETKKYILQVEKNIQWLKQTMILN